MPAAPASSAGFTIFDGRRTAPVLIDVAYGGEHGDRDHAQVRRAVQDLRQDVAMVTGAIDPGEVQSMFVDDDAAKEARLADADQRKVPALLTEARREKTAIIVGQIGQSELIDEIVDAGKLDEAAEIEGEWEAYTTKTVTHPLPGVDKALVIAGSDARGTIYGIYSVSEEIGVSPWYWYNDVPDERRASISAEDSALVDDGPDVQYRGIFINDEERTAQWARKKFPTDQGTPDVNYYRHVFEMMRYRIYFASTGQFTGSFYRIPTLNEGSEDDGTRRTARTAIGLDDQVPTQAVLRGNSVAGNSTSPWGFNIMHGIEPLDFTIDSYHVLVDGRWRYSSAKSGPEAGTDTWYGSTIIAGAALQLDPGRHTISLAPREAGIVLNQIALTTDSTPDFSGFLEPSDRGDS